MDGPAVPDGEVVGMKRFPLPVLIVALALVAAALSAPAGARTSVGVGGAGSTPPLKGVEEHDARMLGGGPPSQLVADNFQVLGHVNLGGGGNTTGDVYFFDHGGQVGKFAYLGSFRAPCGGAGVRIVDVNDPARARLVATAGNMRGVSYEDIVVVRIGDTDVLGAGLQACKSGVAEGVALFDVTDPRNPRQLSLAQTPGGVHELDLVVRPDGTALALLAVPFTEFFDTYFGTSFGGEFRIVDITDPANPVERADWGIIADSSLINFAGNDEVSSSFQGIGYFAAHYDHSVRAADEGMTAYVSYWDSGVLKFDISDPANPVLLARTQYGVEDDGDAHSMVPYDVGEKRYIFQNDEDFDWLSPTIVTSSATGTAEFPGIEESWAPTLLSVTGPVSAEVHDAGDGCEASDFTGASGKIALVDAVDPFYVGIIPGWSVPCDIGGQVVRAAQAGATAMVSNLISPDDSYLFFQGDFRAVQAAAQGMPVVQVSDIDEFAQQVRAAPGPVSMSLDPGDPTWGYIRIFDESSASDVNGDGVPEYEQVGQFNALPHTSGEMFTPPGAWSVHNTEINGDKAYSAWYSHGVVALDLSNPTAPVKVGQFVPPTTRRYNPFFGQDPALVWGAVFDPETGVIYASEIRTGLWIVKPTGPAAP